MYGKGPRIGKVPQTGNNTWGVNFPMVADAPVARARSDSADVTSEVIKQVWAQAGSSPPVDGNNARSEAANGAKDSSVSAPSSSPNARKEVGSQSLSSPTANTVVEGMTHTSTAGSPLPVRPSPRRERPHGSPPGHRSSLGRAQGAGQSSFGASGAHGMEMHVPYGNDYSMIPSLAPPGMGMGGMATGVPPVVGPTVPSMPLGLGFGPEYGSMGTVGSSMHSGTGTGATPGQPNPAQGPNHVSWVADYGMPDAYTYAYYSSHQAGMPMASPAGGYALVPAASMGGHTAPNSSSFPVSGSASGGKAVRDAQNPYPSSLASVPTVGGFTYSTYPMTAPAPTNQSGYAVGPAHPHLQPHPQPSSAQTGHQYGTRNSRGLTGPAAAARPLAHQASPLLPGWQLSPQGLASAPGPGYYPYPTYGAEAFGVPSQSQGPNRRNPPRTRNLGRPSLGQGGSLSGHHGPEGRGNHTSSHNDPGTGPDPTGTGTVRGGKAAEVNGFWAQ